MRVLQPKNALLKGAKNHRVKKVIKSKNDFSKSCPKFCKLGDEFFFILTKSQKMSLPAIFRKKRCFLALEAAFLQFRQNKKNLPPNM